MWMQISTERFWLLHYTFDSSFCHISIYKVFVIHVQFITYTVHYCIDMLQSKRNTYFNDEYFIEYTSSDPASFILCAFRFYFYLLRSQQIRERKALFFFFLLVFLGGDHFSSYRVQFFGVLKGKNFVSKGIWKGKNFVSIGVWKGKNFVSKGVWNGKNFVSKGVWNGKNFVLNWCEKAKTVNIMVYWFVKNILSTPQISERIPFSFLYNLEWFLKKLIQKTNILHVTIRNREGPTDNQHRLIYLKTLCLFSVSSSFPALWWEPGERPGVSVSLRPINPQPGRTRAHA